MDAHSFPDPGDAVRSLSRPAPRHQNMLQELLETYSYDDVVLWLTETQMSTISTFHPHWCHGRAYHYLSSALRASVDTPEMDTQSHVYSHDSPTNTRLRPQSAGSFADSTQSTNGDYTYRLPQATEARPSPRPRELSSGRVSQSISAGQSKTFFCTYCPGGRGFTNQSDWKNHETEFHEMDRFYHCPHCDFRKCLGANAIREHHSRAHQHQCADDQCQPVRNCLKSVYACGFRNCKQFWEDDRSMTTLGRDAWYLRCKHVGEHMSKRHCSVSDWDYSTMISNLLRQSRLFSVAVDVVSTLGFRSIENSTDYLYWSPESTKEMRGKLERSEVDASGNYERPPNRESTFEFINWIYSAAQRRYPAQTTTPHASYHENVPTDTALQPVQDPTNILAAHQWATGSSTPFGSDITDIDVDETIMHTGEWSLAPSGDTSNLNVLQDQSLMQSTPTLMYNDTLNAPLSRTTPLNRQRVSRAYNRIGYDSSDQRPLSTSTRSAGTANGSCRSEATAEASCPVLCRSLSLETNRSHGQNSTLRTRR